MSEAAGNPKTVSSRIQLTPETSLTINWHVETRRDDRSTEQADWPPVHFADNDHILTWWLPDYDEALRRLAERSGWTWILELSALLREIVPEQVLNAWIAIDPLCAQYSWYNVLHNFAIARAKQLGFAPRQAITKTCETCAKEFHELEVPFAYAERVGLENVNFCRDCLTRALKSKGADDTSADQIAAVVTTLADSLGRVPTDADLRGKVDLTTLSAEARRAAIRALAVKPSLERVKEIFGSVSAALASAAETGGLELPPLDRPQQRPVLLREEPAADELSWPTYQLLMGPLPTLKTSLAAPGSTYHDEVRSLIATGALALAEAALRELCQYDATYCFDLARLYAQTARREEAAAALDRYNRLVRSDTAKWFSAQSLPAHRDIRTITTSPIFYAPLTSPPRGNVRFVLVGGPLEYVDRRGEHVCVSGVVTADEDDFVENVSRVNAMAEDPAWVSSAVDVVQSLVENARRSQPGDHYAHVVHFAGPVGQLIKAATGAPFKSIKEDEWCLGPVGKTRWSRERSPGRYIFNAHNGFALVDVRTAPAAVIWAWPDRSDLCLQSFLDTTAAAAHPPVTVVLPDVPHFRRFARAYVRRGRLEHVARAFLEDCLYSGEMPFQRGVVCSAEFAPQLVILEDGRELDGGRFHSALSYLEARHNLRLSVWDVLDDSLLSESATRTPVPPARPVMAAFRRNQVVQWYARYRNMPDSNGDVFRHYRPRLLDAV